MPPHTDMRCAAPAGTDRVFNSFLFLFYGFMVQQKLYLQAEPRVCEQPVFTAQQNYIHQACTIHLIPACGSNLI